MKILEVDDDVYEFIVSHPILRRVMRAPGATKELLAPVPKLSEAAILSAPLARSESADERLLAFVASAEFRAIGRATKKFLAILGFAWREDRSAFEQNVLVKIRGRTRKYFGRSAKEIAETGRRVHPRQIPNTPLWALTNASTYQKGQMLREALTALGYGWDAAVEASRRLY